MPEIRLIPCLSDNYAVLVKEGETVVLVDAPDAAPIEAVLEREGWRLTHILITHEHHDHVDGIPALVAKYSAEVFGPEGEKARIPHIGRALREGDVVEAGPLRAEVYDTPGHSVGHICYHFPKERLLFSGDTLFALGCGRLFGGTPTQMWDSLQKLRALPDDTDVYCGHEYTASNAKFSLSVDPKNAKLVERARQIDEARGAGKPTIPFNLGLDKATNPFLRADDPTVAAGVGKAGASAEAVFAELRERKNNF